MPAPALKWHRTHQVAQERAKAPPLVQFYYPQNAPIRVPQRHNLNGIDPEVKDIILAAYPGYDLSIQRGQHLRILETDSRARLKQDGYPLGHLPKKLDGPVVGITLPARWGAERIRKCLRGDLNG